MQSNLNKSNENNKNINKNIIDEILLNNQSILLQLIIENVNRKEKSLISTTEYDYIKDFEKNLMQLIEKCPVNKLNEILNEINGKIPKENEDKKMHSIEEK